MPNVNACRGCGNRLVVIDEADARRVGCAVCGWELSIPCGEPLTLEVADVPGLGSAARRAVGPGRGHASPLSILRSVVGLLGS